MSRDAPARSNHTRTQPGSWIGSPRCGTMASRSGRVYCSSLTHTGNMKVRSRSELTFPQEHAHSATDLNRALAFLQDLLSTGSMEEWRRQRCARTSSRLRPNEYAVHPRWLSMLPAAEHLHTAQGLPASALFRCKPASWQPEGSPRCERSPLPRKGGTGKSHASPPPPAPVVSIGRSFNGKGRPSGPRVRRRPLPPPGPPELHMA